MSWPISLENIGVFLLFLGLVLLFFYQRYLSKHSGVKALETQLHTLKNTHVDLYRLLQDSLQKGMGETRQQVLEILQHNITLLNRQFDTLNKTTVEHLTGIQSQVEKRLEAGFEKTTATFTDIVKRLALIDEAQKKITDLSHHVISLQSILVDKRARGVFGEVQLENLIHDVLPKDKFALQYTLKNNKRADCVLFLPPPTGTIAIDAKFPLENFRNLQKTPLTPQEIQQFKSLFKRDLMKHIQDISEKYICPPETAQGAIMFIPSEAVFSEIHANFQEVVDIAFRSNVWIVSPTTMMAILTTARAVLKDEAARQQIHIVQTHLVALAKDFGRFQQRMDNLSKHIQQAHHDVQDVHTSAKKISHRFQKIENMELEQTQEFELPQ